MSENNGSILKVTNLKTYFQTEDGVVKAVDGITFELKKGETLGIVGESGSGKSVTNLSVMRLISPPGKIVGGEILFEDENLLAASEELRGSRDGLNTLSSNLILFKSSLDPKDVQAALSRFV